MISPITGSRNVNDMPGTPVCSTKGTTPESYVEAKFIFATACTLTAPLNTALKENWPIDPKFIPPVSETDGQEMTKSKVAMYAVNWAKHVWQITEADKAVAENPAVLAHAWHVVEHDAGEVSHVLGQFARAHDI